jgi:hypothetical protein
MVNEMKTGKRLEELALELKRQNNNKRDFLAPACQILVKTEDKHTTLDLDACGVFPARETAHSQLAEFTGIPKGYYDRLREQAPNLFDYNVNHWLSLNTSNRLVRTLDGHARAVLSGKYRPLDNFDLAEAALPVLQDRGFEIMSCEVTERRFYLKAVTPRIQGEVKRGDLVQAGLCISNSEIGEGTLKIDPMLFFLVCTNGMIAADNRVKKYHVGRAIDGLENAMEFYRSETRQADDRAFWLKIRDVLAGILTQDFLDRQLHKLRASAEQPFMAPAAQVVEVTAKRFHFTNDERESVLENLIQGHNNQPELTRYGLAQAITRASHGIEDYERATEFECFGGQIIELQADQWRSLAEAI